MRSRLGGASIAACRLSRAARWLPWALAIACWPLAVLPAEARPAAALLLDRMCAQTLRHNEEDRLFGLISLTVRTTIKYEGGLFSPDLIDDSIQDALDDMIGACTKIAATADIDRLGMVVEMIRAATIKRLQDPEKRYSETQTQKATAADLSEELSSSEIDSWLGALPARQRALALFLYASDVTPKEIADAVGLPPAALPIAFRNVKANLLRFFRAQWDTVAPPPIPAPPAMQYSVAGLALARLLKSAAAGPPLEDAMPMAPAAGPTARVTGISSDVYAGWSLLALVTGLPPERSLELDAPVLLAPDNPGQRRMIVTAFDEIGDPHDVPRRFLLQAYAIDAEKDGAGLRDSFHLGAATVDNPQALETLRNRTLSSIETARCLWHDYGTGPDPDCAARRVQSPRTRRGKP